MEAQSTPTEAPQTTDDLQSELEQTRRRLQEAEAALDAAERRRAIDRALIRSRAIDLETAAMLTEAAVAGMEAADVDQAVEDLKRTKPFLFARAAQGGAMSAIEDEDTQRRRLAEDARRTGDRRTLLRYLRLRRQS